MLLSNRRECYPTTEQLQEPDNVYTLAYQTLKSVKKLGISEKAIDNYTLCGLNAILRCYEQNGLTKYDREFTTDFVEESRKIKNRSAAQCVTKAAAWLEEYHQTGKIEWSILPNYGQRILSGEYRSTLSLYSNHITETGCLFESTKVTVITQCKRFLFEMEDNGIFHFIDISHKSVSNTVVNLTKAYAGGYSSIIFSIKSFLKYLFEFQITSFDLSLAVPRMVAPRKVVREGFTVDESQAILDATKANLVSPKRDYAIAVLAAVTGIRAVDISLLKKEDINWRLNEIRIIQHKTGKELTLPLTPDVGNAVADYLLNERPVLDDSTIFLCARKPYRKLHRASIVNIVHRYLIKLGIYQKNSKRFLGIHSFRRSLGRRLLSIGEPLPMISEMLGHTSPNSSKVYLSIHDEELKKCCLPLLTAKEETECE
jgi:integrase